MYSIRELFYNYIVGISFIPSSIVAWHGSFSYTLSSLYKNHWKIIHTTKSSVKHVLTAWNVTETMMTYVRAEKKIYVPGRKKNETYVIRCTPDFPQ